MKSFIYQDEKSHKFWAVEQQDNELHLSWGKVGTSGQSQIKTFADSATAAKAKQKLIGEKTRKGYAENTAAEKSPPQAVASQSNNRPWLADDAHIPLTEEIGWFAFPHRNRSRPFNTTPTAIRFGNALPGMIKPNSGHPTIISRHRPGNRPTLNYTNGLSIINPPEACFPKRLFSGKWAIILVI